MKIHSIKTSNGTIIRFLIAMSSMLLYVLIFPVAYPNLGLFAGMFNAIPVVVFGWFMGVRGGFLYLLIGLPINLVLFTLVRSPNNDLITHLLGISFYTLISIGVGWVRDLRELNDRIHTQTIKLEVKQKLLEEEILRRTRAEEKLAHEALHDPLTDLPNRRLFFNRLEHAYAWSKRNPHNLSAVLYLDLDKLKTINDGMGHQAGDDLLKQFADRLKSSVRDIDTVARLGGDEFAILLEAASTAGDVKTVIQRIHACLSLPYELQGNLIVCGTSIGVVIDIAAYEQLDDILRDADTAMYRSKVSGGDQYTVFDAELQK